MTEAWRRPIRRLHRASAVVVGAYALVHLANHVVGLMGVAWHLRFMDAARLVYRSPSVEALLLACVAFQVTSGLWLALSRTPVWGGSARARVQAASGTLLSAFLAVHVSAVLFGRMALALDTNFYFAAAGLHVANSACFFAPYYFLGVASLFTHVACAPPLRALSEQGRIAVRALVFAIGCGLALLFVMALRGAFYPVTVPPEFEALLLSNTR